MQASRILQTPPAVDDARADEDFAHELCCALQESLNSAEGRARWLAAPTAASAWSGTDTGTGTGTGARDGTDRRDLETARAFVRPAPRHRRALASVALAPVGALCGGIYGRGLAAVGVDLGIYAAQGRIFESFAQGTAASDVHSGGTCLLLYGMAGMVGAAYLPWLTPTERARVVRSMWLGAQGPPTLGLCAAVGASVASAAAFGCVEAPSTALLQLASTGGAAFGAAAGAWAIRRLAPGASRG